MNLVIRRNHWKNHVEVTKVASNFRNPKATDEHHHLLPMFKFVALLILVIFTTYQNQERISVYCGIETTAFRLPHFDLISSSSTSNSYGAARTARRGTSSNDQQTSYRILSGNEEEGNMIQRNATNQTKAAVFDASIIITSSLIPTHPSISMIFDMIQSIFMFLEGLPLDTPIFITVDGIKGKPTRKQRIPRTDNMIKQEQLRLVEYIHQLEVATFEPFTNVNIVFMEKHMHLAGSINYTLSTLVDTEFVYILQHDLFFCHRPINHTLLIQTMKEHPKTLYNVRFKLDDNPRTLNASCPLHNDTLSDFPPEEYNGLNFFAVDAWSDNNHIANTAYYRSMLNALQFLTRAMENPMQKWAEIDCKTGGQQIYGTRRVGALPNICHVDGRESKVYNSTFFREQTYTKTANSF